MKQGNLFEFMLARNMIEFAGSNPARVAAHVATRPIVAEGSDPSAALQCIWVPLLKREYAEAMGAAAKRLARALELGRVGVNGQPRWRWELDNKLGCLGERAYLVRFHLPFSLMDYYPFDLRAATGGRKPADFGNHDVKTKQSHGTHLLVNKGNPREYVYILASAALGNCVVEFCGWQRGEVIMQPQYWEDKAHNRRACYWYPMSKLQPMSTLPDRHVAKLTQ